MTFDTTVALIPGIEFTGEQAKACRILESRFGMEFCVHFGTDNALSILRGKVAEQPRAIHEHSFECHGLWWFGKNWEIVGPYDTELLAEYYRENELDRLTWGDFDGH